MALKNKVHPSCLEAIRDIPDGATIGFGGFALPGLPGNLILALAEQGAKDLTLVANTTGGTRNDPGIGMLVARGQVRRAICAFTAATRASQKLPFTEFYEAGKVEAELVPQGTLAERLRAAGAGIPAFYTPTAVGTELAEGRETRMFGGREYLLEEALPLDYAFVRAWRADTFGNLQYRRSQRNFNPVMAMAARITVAEVEEDIFPLGAIDPDQVHTAGVFVSRVVRIPPAPQAWWPQRPGSQAA
ncbi:MAG TPA: 3-oxoacid CoA-transferase subunit A [Acetobacteraceae bacterium]|nr:3-oxoacid CoA-transferase subunit A [Acetobacteraceae bacterium]